MFSARSVRKNITCAAIRPGLHNQVVTGHSDGQVHLWSWNGQKAKLENAGLIEGEFSGAVKSVCFTSDGAYLTAAGDGLTIWVGAMGPGRTRSTSFPNFGHTTSSRSTRSRRGRACRS